MFSKIRNFYSQYVPFEERLVHVLMALLLSVALMGVLVNALTTHYVGIFYGFTPCLKLAPFFHCLLIFSMYAEKKAPARLIFFTRVYTTFYFIIIILGLAITGIQYTPFSVIDPVLAKLDLALGFDTPALLHWTAMHPGLKKVFDFAYYMVGAQMFAVVLILALFKDRWVAYEFFIAGLSAFFIAILVYYFFPTAAPVSVFHSPYFSTAQQATAIKFHEVHHYLPTTTKEGGMIAFPSCHVIWAVLLTYSLRSKAWLFYPVAALNLMGILSTVFLGWHYLLDLLAALVVVTVCILLARYSKRYTNEVFS